MPFTLVVGNVKGGVGKSTTAAQLALHAAALGQRTLLIDADPGRSALSWATRAGDEWPHAMAPVIAHHTPDLPRRLDGLAAGYELVIVDTPHDPTGAGQVGPMLASAIAVADLLVIPTSPAPADLDRLGDLLEAVDREEARRRFDWTLALVMVDLRRRTLATELHEALGDRRLPLAPLATAVPTRAAVADAFGTGRPLVEYSALAAHLFAAVATGALT